MGFSEQRCNWHRLVPCGLLCPTDVWSPWHVAKWVGRLRPLLDRGSREAKRPWSHFRSDSHGEVLVGHASGNLWSGQAVWRRWMYRVGLQTWSESSLTRHLCVRPVCDDLCLFSGTLSHFRICLRSHAFTCCLTRVPYTFVKDQCKLFTLLICVCRVCTRLQTSP